MSIAVCQCGLSEGQLHVFGCRWEFCPFCELQMIECDCAYDLIGLRHRGNPPETDWLEPEVYSRGLSAAWRLEEREEPLVAS